MLPDCFPRGRCTILHTNFLFGDGGSHGWSRPRRNISQATPRARPPRSLYLQCGDRWTPRNLCPALVSHRNLYGIRCPVAKLTKRTILLAFAVGWLRNPAIGLVGE